MEGRKLVAGGVWETRESETHNSEFTANIHKPMVTK